MTMLFSGYHEIGYGGLLDLIAHSHCSLKDG